MTDKETVLTEQECQMLAKLIVGFGIDILGHWPMAEGFNLFRKLGLRVEFVPLEGKNEHRERKHGSKE